MYSSMGLSIVRSLPTRQVTAAAPRHVLQMPSSSKPPPFPIRLECVSWQLVQHHLRHGALRFEEDALKHLRLLQPTDHASRFCIATRPEDLIEVLGVTHYRVTDDDLFFEYIGVREAYRCRGIGRKMLTEVVTHPTCIGLPRIHFAAVSEGGDALIRHLEWLRDNVQRLCGTPFALDAKPMG